MPGGFAPRFAIEAGFLILLGVAAGFADLRTSLIVALLAGAWVIVSLIELAVWRAGSRPAAATLLPSAAPEEGLAPEPEPPAPEPTLNAEDTEYPLRADAGATPSAEIEEYTRILGGEGEDGAPSERAE